MAAQHRPLVVIRQARVFSALNNSDYSTLIASLEQRRLREGEALCTQGEPGNAMYVLASGALELRLEGEDGGSETIGRLEPGEVVGEMSCIDSAPRSASVVAVSEEGATVFKLSGLTFRRFKEVSPRLASSILRGVVAHVTERLRQIHAQVRALRAAPTWVEATEAAGEALAPGSVSLDELAALDSLRGWELDRLLELAPPRGYGDGEVLCKEGEAGDACFLVVQGEVEVLKATHQGDELLAVLGRGALVGQMALVDGAERSATVRARGEVVTLRLTRDTFEALLREDNPLGLRVQEVTAVAGIRQLRMANRWLVSAATATRRGEQVSAEEESIAGLESALGEWGVEIDALDAPPIAVSLDPHPAEI